jgi:hypothetical protein
MDGWTGPGGGDRDAGVAGAPAQNPTEDPQNFAFVRSFLQVFF